MAASLADRRDRAGEAGVSFRKHDLRTLNWSSTLCSPSSLLPRTGHAPNCSYNSGVYLRTGYQVNFGRREAGEFIGVVVHRVHPKAIRGNVLWLDTGDEKFPNLRKKEDWNHVQISFKGPRLQVTLYR